MVEPYNGPMPIVSASFMPLLPRWCSPLVRSPLRLRLLIGACALLLLTQPVHTQVSPRTPAVTRQQVLPHLGEAGALDIAQERRLGDRIAQQIYRDPDLLDDPVLVDYVQSLWTRLHAAARARGELSPELAERFAWTVFLSRERSINAFALPGGYFGVHVGLLAQVGSADELAAVLAHELSHVTQRHISRLIAKQDQQSVWVIGAMILGALAASAAKNADVAQAAIVGSQAVAAQTQLNFSRDMEREADRLGYGILTDAGFEGQGFVRMFDRLWQASRHQDDGAFPYLRSHPLTTERMADMSARVGVPTPSSALVPKAATAEASASVWTHHLMSARARVWAEPDAVRWREWVQQAQGLSRVPPSSTTMRRTKDADPATWGVRYAGAFAAWRLQDFDAAWSLAHDLWQQAAQQPATVPILRALLLELASHPKAWAQMPPALKNRFAAEVLAPALQAPDRASMLWAAQVGVLHRPETLSVITERLRWWVTDRPQDAAAWHVLAKAWTQMQQPLRALRAEAESKAAVLDWAGAVDRLRSAQDWMRQHPDSDAIEQSIIDARYRQFQQRLQDDVRDQAAEKSDNRPMNAGS